MSSALLYWGNCQIIPPGITSHLSYGIDHTGMGLRIAQHFSGPGCGDFACSSSKVTLTFISRYYLAKRRMPESGRVFESRPCIDFAGHIKGHTNSGTCWDGPFAKLGICIRQYIYSGGVHLTTEQTEWPRFINVTDRNDSDIKPFHGRKFVPEFQWTLDRNYNLEIDVEVSFTINIEGSGYIQFLGPDLAGPYTFNIPQFEIRSIN